MGENEEPVMRKVKCEITEFVYGDDEPEACSVLDCNEFYNALYHAQLSIGRHTFCIDVCRKHRDKIEREIKKQG